MKKLLRIFTLLGGAAAVGWMARRRLLSAGMGREPIPPQPAPEPAPEPQAAADGASATGDTKQE